MHILYTIAMILLALWVVGLIMNVGSGLIHLLLVVAIAVAVYRLITGRKIA